jgi:GxxExxY protein
MNTDRHGTAKDKNQDLLYKELTGDIIDSAYRVHGELGCGLLEAVYGNALAWDLDLKKRDVAQQREFRVMYRDKEVGIYYADHVVDDKVIVEVKAVVKLDDVHRAQLLNYLRISRMRVGLLINFARTKLEYERFVV